MANGDTILIVFLLFLGLLCIVALFSAPPHPQPVVVIQPSPAPELSELRAPVLPQSAKEITCMVVIPEFIFEERVTAPAVETAVIRELLLGNFSVVDQQMVDKIRYRDETLLAAYGDNMDAIIAIRALAHDYSADVLLIGRAFTEGQFSAPGDLISTRAWAEVRAIDVRTGRIFAAEQTSAGGTDMVLSIAAKKALQNAGVVIGKAVTQALERRFGKQQGTQDRVELILIRVPLDAYVSFKQQLQLFPYVKQILADHYTVDQAHVTIYYAHTDLIDLVNYFRHMDIAGGRLEVLTYSLSRVVMRYRQP